MKTKVVCVLLVSCSGAGALDFVLFASTAEFLRELVQIQTVLFLARKASDNEYRIWLFVL